MVKTMDQHLLGYVPAFYSEFMTDILDEGYAYLAKITKIDFNAIPQLKVKIKVVGEVIKNENYNKSESDKLLPLQFI